MYPHHQPLMQPVFIDGNRFSNHTPSQQQPNGRPHSSHVPHGNQHGLHTHSNQGLHLSSGNINHHINRGPAHGNHGPPSHSIPQQHQQLSARSLSSRRKRYQQNQIMSGGHNNNHNQSTQIGSHSKGQINGQIDHSNNEMLSNGCLTINSEPVQKMHQSSEAQVKTPVSVLQEVLSKRGITPSYELVQIEGAIHEPTFRYRVSFNDKDAMGAGKSKKEAKHAAAKALIEKLTEQSLYTNLSLSQAVAQNTNCVTLSSSSDTDPNTSVSEDQVAGNPIGWLQEQCMIRRWPPPTYETETEVGLPHQREFTIACVVLKFYEVGQGKSKKIAKRQAAHKMWLLLQNYPIDGPGCGSGDATGNDENRVTNRYGDLKDAHIPTLTNQHSYKVSQFHKTMKANCGRNLAALQTTCLSTDRINYVQFLHAIATEHQFEVTYVDIEEKTYKGHHQCLVQLSTLPVAVCPGSGETSNEAQANAARTALEYLKIMTKM